MEEVKMHANTLMAALVLPTKDDLRKVGKDAQIQHLKETRRRLRAQQRVERLFGIINTTLRFPLYAGKQALDVAQSVAPRLYADLVAIPEGFRALTLSSNAQKNELGGHVLEFDREARGVKASTILSRKHAFGVTAVFTLQENTAGTLKIIRGQYAEALKASVEKFARDAPPAEAVLAASDDDAHDGQRWAAYLPVHSRVGIYRKDRTLFLFIKASAGLQMDAAIDAILSEDEMTMGAFVVDHRVHRLKNAVVRNVERVAATIAKDLNFTVPIRDDNYTRLSDDLSYYELAEPTFIIRHNHMRVDALARSVHVYVDAACSSAILYGDNEYAVWCGRTHDYVVAIRPNDGDAQVLPLKTDKLVDEERTTISDEEHEDIGAHVQYLLPRAAHVGAIAKYRSHGGTSPVYKHVSSVHI